MEARQWWDEGRDATRDVRRVVLEEPPAKLLKQGGFKRGSASWQKNQEERAGVLSPNKQAFTMTSVKLKPLMSLSDSSY